MNNQEYEQKKKECWEEAVLHGALEVDKDLLFDHAFKCGYALGKQEKDAEETSIYKEEYEKLCKYRRYAANWAHGIMQCAHCGELNPSGCICANCGKESHHYYG